MFGWLRRKKQPPRGEVEIHDIVSDYGRYLEQNPIGVEIVDQVHLPHPKEEILSSLCIAVAMAGEDSPEHQHLVAAALLLAQFQPDIGDESLYPLGADVASLDPAAVSPHELVKLVSRSPTNRDRFKKLAPIVKSDLRSITRRIEMATRIGRS